MPGPCIELPDCLRRGLNGLGHEQNRARGRALRLRTPQVAQDYRGGLDQECSVENIQRRTTERYRQPLQSYSSNVPRLQECFQPRQNQCGVISDNGCAAGGNDGSLAGGNVCRAVVMLVARLIALVCQNQRGAVGFAGMVAGLPDDDENRREDKHPSRHQSKIPRDLHQGGGYRAGTAVSRADTADDGPL